MNLIPNTQFYGEMLIAFTGQWMNSILTIKDQLTLKTWILTPRKNTWRKWIYSGPKNPSILSVKRVLLQEQTLHLPCRCTRCFVFYTTQKHSFLCRHRGYLHHLSEEKYCRLIPVPPTLKHSFSNPSTITSHHLTPTTIIML